jgi:hypothetical protein
MRHNRWLRLCRACRIIGVETGEDVMQLETIFQLCQNGCDGGMAGTGGGSHLRGSGWSWAARGVALVLALAYLIQFFTITEMTEGGFSSLAGIVGAVFKGRQCDDGLDALSGVRSVCGQHGKWRMPGGAACRTGWSSPACSSR